jgi:hypothetical protein
VLSYGDMRMEDQDHLERFGRWMSPGGSGVDHFYPASTPFVSLCKKRDGALNGIDNLPMCAECEALAVDFVEGCRRAETSKHERWLDSDKRKLELHDAVVMLGNLDARGLAEVMETLRSQTRRRTRHKQLDASMTSLSTRRVGRRRKSG